ncbi:MAG: exodeoxyribonuclease VII large subunit [Ruminococcaceae bacterium]|nr:exodeoxyribonuclease VII large subunit [Oscillospiraceae bacterium]
MDISSLRERDNVNTFTVSELNNYIKNIFESNRTLSAVTVRGEISNFTSHRSGHLYFSLKDAEGQIRAVMFRSRAMMLKFMPESGMKVVLHGSVTVYPRDGSYQIYVSSMQPDGIGALYLAYEQLKERLAAEGLFSEEHKRLIPEMPRRVGVITSPTGAAVRDIINVTGRRFPSADIYLYPALVQGEGAERMLIDAVDYFDKTKLCDVIIIGRGGGSIEDLWAFNSEALARRIFAASVPIISAVGHETDFTICDFVADMRAPTPSAAAELAVPDRRELMMRLDSCGERAYTAIINNITRLKERVGYLTDKTGVKATLSFIETKKETVEAYRQKAVLLIRSELQRFRDKLAVNASKADALSPLSILSRGYSVAEGKQGIVKRADDVSVGDELRLTLSDGKIVAEVTEIIKEK